MNRTARWVVLAGTLSCLVLAGCHGTGVERLKAFLQEPRAPVSASEYRVFPPDVLAIASIKVPEINNVRQQVRPDGKINLPLIGEIDTAGRTPKEIEASINEAARKYYEQVDATVSVAIFNSQMIYVFGQVSRPGPQPWNGTNTVMDVLALCQPTTLAWPERIHIVRGKPPRRGGYLPDEEKAKQPEPPDQEKAATDAGGAALTNAKPPEAKAADDKTVAQVKDIAAKEAEAKAAIAAKEKKDEGPAKAEVMVINMMAMVESGDLSRNVMLQPDDVVYVPPNPLAAVGLALQQVLLPIRPAAETVYAPAQAATMAGGR
jgi:hypothetical protein